MKPSQKLWASAVLGLTITLLACSPAKGACIRGTGVTQSCGNDFTSASCDFIGGNAFHESRTCEDLGFSPTP